MADEDEPKIDTGLSLTENIATLVKRIVDKIGKKEVALDVALTLVLSDTLGHPFVDDETESAILSDLAISFDCEFVDADSDEDSEDE